MQYWKLGMGLGTDEATISGRPSEIMGYFVVKDWIGTVAVVVKG